MQVYAFDLMPWPHLADASYYPDSNRLLRSSTRPAGLRRALPADGALRGVRLRRDLHQRAPRQALRAHALAEPDRRGARPSGPRRSRSGSSATCPRSTRNPVRLAEEVAMLDVMSGGRIISGFVRGVPQEFLAYSVPLADARAPSDRGVGSDREGVDGARAVRVARQVLRLRPGLHLAAAAPAAAPADHPARRQRRGARDRRPAAACRPAPPTGRSAGPAPSFERYRELAAAKHGWTPGPRALSPRAPRVRGRDERAGPRGGRAAHRLFLAEAPQLSPRLDGAHGPVGAAAAGADREGRGRAALRARLRPLPEGRPDDHRRSRLRRPRDPGPGSRAGRRACSWGSSSSAPCPTRSRRRTSGSSARRCCPRSSAPERGVPDLQNGKSTIGSALTERGQA